MTIKVGEKLPGGVFMRLREEVPEPVQVSALTEGRKIALFGLPGAFTATCSSAHLPSFIRSAKAIMENGVDEVVCMSVNDPWVMQAWDKDTGASQAGITMLTDPDGTLTKAMGLAFSAPPVGFIDRTRRFAAIVEDGVVTWIQEEEERGVCNFTAGETLLEAL
ncbi:thiol peroxidase (atypical 2-Cys peroxiredoxin) [Shimia gijangensis]|uniref:Glutathione-dependent peroxiredoxin n=1 Tax=Shimia gijangensis TaxID=1470563 RepID=A0A1M6BPG5_9RHOB|nr:peroxiredoxin [Shimia gijangensis]SHI50629.1 thiol peroxidase (atypical 2-Cys peroxiredoxin) [Shimia gijangensis]